MGSAHAPNSVTTGLMFNYDMGNTKKSWYGAPTTNQFTLPSVPVNGFGVQNSTFTRVYSGTYGGYTLQPTDYVWQYNITGNDCPYHGWDIPTTAGTVVTFSFDFYISPTSTNYPSTNSLAAMENAGSGVGGSIGDPTPAITGVWKRVYFSSTASATGNSRCLLYPGGCGTRLADSGFILYKNPQVEFNAPGSVPTPFVAGTRYANSNLETTPIPTWNASGDGSTASGGTLTFVAGSYNSKGTWDLYKTYSGLTANINYTWSALVKLGTATNFVVTMNNTAAWNTGPWTNFFSGLSTTEWIRISITGSSSTGSFNIHLGSGANTDEVAVVQSAGTVYIQDVRLVPTVSQTALVDMTDVNTINASSLTYASDNTFSFNGSTNRFQTTMQTFGNNMTWEAWIYPTASNNPYNMFMGRVLPYFSFYGGVQLYFSNTIGGSQQSISTASNLSLNTWYHAMFTTSYNGSNTTMKIYTNGVETASGTFAGAQGNDSNYFCVGDGQAGVWYPFTGKVAVVKVYNQTFTAQQVAQNFNALRGRFGV